MKKIVLSIVMFVLALTINAQNDTMYIMKNGVIADKYNIKNQVDSIIFYQPTVVVQNTVTDIDGNVYNTVTIGTQTWMVENLKTTKYNDGTSIPNVTNDDAWADLSTGAYCNYDNLESNVATYGRFYNWYAVNTGKLAPAGWHVPTYNDWSILEKYLIANGYNWDGSKDGNKIAKSLCSKTGWESEHIVGSPGVKPENNNSTGFTALPVGSRDYSNGAFGGIGKEDCWWSSTERDGDYAYCRVLSYTLNYLLSNNLNKGYGFSIRLVKD